MLVIVFLIGWAMLTRNLTTPWFGHHDGNGVWVSAGVLNWHRYGFDELRGMVIINYDPATPDTYSYYPNHPPLAVWSIGMTSLLAGIQSTELIGRWTMACFTLISLAGLYVFTRRLLSQKIALYASLIYILTPMIAYYGRMPNHEAPALAFILLFSAVIAKYLTAPTWARVWLLCLLGWGAVWTAWSAILIVACVGLAGLLLAKTIRTRLMLMVVGMSGLLALIALLVYYEWGRAGAVNLMMGMFTARTDATSSYQTGYVFTMGEFILKQVGELLLFATPAVCILGIMGLWVLFRGQWAQYIAPLQGYGTDNHAKWLIGALLMGGLGYIILLRDPAFSHDFLKIFLVPPLAIGTSLIIAEFSHRKTFRVWGRVLIGVSMVIGAGWFLTLHILASSQTLPYAVALAIRESTMPQERVMTNVKNMAVGVDFYAFRRIERSVLWENVPLDAVYLACGDDADEAPAQWVQMTIIQECVLWRYSG
ncbi:MAG TPA: glycosyltransferase family 39 protein [Aggregatilineales bacterium]|nr:glycosyltransferase family 39 protein [Aggregatilineales bacterium]